jgi:hypothetical protein
MLKIKKDIIGNKVLSKLYITNSMETKELKTNIDSNLVEDASECRLNTNSHEAIVEYKGNKYDTGLMSKDVLRHFSLL